MTSDAPQPREYFIVGLTADGKPFRPSDWAERLAGAMSSFGPDGEQSRRPSPFICYSPYCVPQLYNGVRSVLVSQALEAVEPRAWEFVMAFARDNGLQVIEHLPETDKP